MGKMCCFSWRHVEMGKDLTSLQVGCSFSRCFFFTRKSTSILLLGLIDLVPFPHVKNIQLYPTSFCLDPVEWKTCLCLYHSFIDLRFGFNNLLSLKLTASSPLNIGLNAPQKEAKDRLTSLNFNPCSGAWNTQGYIHSLKLRVHL